MVAVYGIQNSEIPSKDRYNIVILILFELMQVSSPRAARMKVVPRADYLGSATNQVRVEREGNLNVLCS